MSNSSVIRITPLFYRAVIDHTRKLDASRPITFACKKDYYSDRAVCANIYICMHIATSSVAVIIATYNNRYILQKLKDY